MGNETSSLEDIAPDVPECEEDSDTLEAPVQTDEVSAGEQFLVQVPPSEQDEKVADVSEPSQETSLFPAASLIRKATLGVKKTLDVVESASSAGKEVLAVATRTPYTYVRNTASGAAATGAAAFAAWGSAGARDTQKDRNIKQSLRDRLLVAVSPPDDLHDLCATVCHELNFHEDPGTFRAAVAQACGQDSVKAAILVNQGSLHSRLALVIKERIAVVAWRGSKTPVEWVTDSGFSPSICHLWLHLCDQIQVHGAMMAVIEHDFYAHHKKLLAKIAEFGVERLAFSGHSLGGALAQVAHLAMMGQKSVLHIENLQIQTVAFAAPMVFYVAGAISDTTSHILAQLFERSINWIYHADVAPRMPGHPEFWMPAMKDLVATLAKRKIADSGNRFGKAVTWKLLFGDGRLDVLFDAFERHTKATVDALRGYRHTSQLFLVCPYAGTVSKMDHFEFLNVRYGNADDGKGVQNAESELLADFHGCLPRNMARTHGFFRLKHVDSGMCITISSSCEVGLVSNWGQNRDELFWKRVRVPWYVRPPDGTFKLENKAFGKVLTVPVEGDFVEVSDDADSDEQYWRLIAGADGAFQLESLASGKILGMFEEDGRARLVLCRKESRRNHQWKIIREKRRASIAAEGLEEAKNL